MKFSKKCTNTCTTNRFVSREHRALHGSLSSLLMDQIQTLSEFICWYFHDPETQQVVSVPRTAVAGAAARLTAVLVKFLYSLKTGTWGWCLSYPSSVVLLLTTDRNLLLYLLTKCYIFCRTDTKFVIFKISQYTYSKFLTYTPHVTGCLLSILIWISYSCASLELLPPCSHSLLTMGD